MLKKIKILSKIQNNSMTDRHKKTVKIVNSKMLLKYVRKNP